jgi:cytochrome P450
MLKLLARLLGGDLPELVKDPLGIFTRLAREPGGVSPLRIGPRRAVLVSDPVKIRQVLLENFDRYDKDTPAFAAVRLALGRGLLTSSGAFWKRQRRIAQPAFHGENLKRFAPIFERLAAECAERWELARQSGEPVDAGTDMMKVTLTAVAEALFGEDLSGKAEEFNRVFPVILHGLACRTAMPIPLPMWVPSPRNRELSAALASLDAIVVEMIRKRRAVLSEISAQSSERRDLLSTLMLAKDEETSEGMSDAQLRDEVMTLLIAGHETTANALSWIWVLLHRHPDEQERLRDELYEVTGGRAPTVDDLPQLKRLRMVFMEALRLYPPVWMFDRRAVKSDRLGDAEIKPGNLVIISAYAVHRIPSLWRDPEEFRPERFEPGQEEQKNKFAYLPFGAGPRICMGMSFAMIESQIILGTLLSKFRTRLATPDTIAPQTQVTLRPDQPVLLALEKIG